MSTTPRARAFIAAVKLAELKYRRRMREPAKMACGFCYTDPDLLCGRPDDCYLLKRQQEAASRKLPAVTDDPS